MSMFFNQMLGCLIIAACIGGAVGWLLRNVSASKLTQQLTDVTAMMHLKEQMLEKARYQLRDSASKMQSFKEEGSLTPQERSVIAGNQCVDTDRLHTRLQESESAGGLVEWLDVQLTKRDEQHRIALHEVELQLAERDRRISELEQHLLQLKMQAEDNEALPADKAA
jgi:chaperonin cofactor prefoldin